MNKLKQRNLTNTLLLAASLLLLVFIAAGLGDMVFQPGEPLNLLDWFFSALESRDQEPVYRENYTQSDILPEIGETLLNSLVAVLWVMIVASIIMIFTSPKFRREMLRMLAFIVPMMILLPQIAEAMQQEAEVIAEEGAVGSASMGDFIPPQPPIFVQQCWLARI